MSPDSHTPRQVTKMTEIANMTNHPMPLDQILLRNPLSSRQTGRRCWEIRGSVAPYQSRRCLWGKSPWTASHCVWGLGCRTWSQGARLGPRTSTPVIETDRTPIATTWCLYPRQPTLVDSDILDLEYHWSVLSIFASSMPPGFRRFRVSGQKTQTLNPTPKP